MTVDPKHHKHFVARRGEVLHRITDECGGVMISFPRSGVTSDRVTLKGAKECIELAKQRINEIVAELEAMITIDCVIEQKHHRTVMGAKGCKVQQITSEHDVQIKFPDRDATGVLFVTLDSDSNQNLAITLRTFRLFPKYCGNHGVATLSFLHVLPSRTPLHSLLPSSFFKLSLHLLTFDIPTY